MWHGKQISFPDSIYCYINDSLIINQDDPLFSKELKIITFIAGDCISCIETLNRFTTFIDSINTFRIVKPIIIIITSDFKQFMNNFYDLINNKTNIFFDLNFNFLKKYMFPNDISLWTFLLENDNKVIIIGNPIYSSEVKKLYLRTILNYNTSSFNN
jgi:hypothetical protein